MYEYIDSPSKLISNNGDNSLELKKNTLSNNLEKKSSILKQTLEVKVKLDKHQKRKSTDEPNIINLVFDGGEIDKINKKSNESATKFELKGLQGGVLQKSGNSSNSNAVNLSSQRGINVVSINFDKKKSQIKNATNNSSNKGKLEKKSNQSNLVNYF